MTEPSILTAVNDGIARITLNRPAKLNAFDVETARLFGEQVRRVGSDAEARVLIIDGAGRNFCAGGDVGTMAAAADPAPFIAELADTMHDSLRALADLPMPVVGALHGAVRGAGVGLALACDVLVAGESTTIRAAYSGVGLSPDSGVSYLLPYALGLHRALRFVLLDETLDAAAAEQLGLLAAVVPDGELAARTTEFAQRIASTAPRSLGRARVLIRSASGRYGEHLDDESRNIAEQIVTDEAQQAIARFASGGKGKEGV